MGESTTATIDGTQQGAAVASEAARLAAAESAPMLDAPPPGVGDPNAWFRRGWKLRLTLTLIAVVFLVLFVVVPVVNVFAQALKGGWGAYVGVFRPTVNHSRIDEVQAALKDAKRVPFSERRKLSKELGELLAPAERAKKNWDAVRMTLGVAAVVVPMNLVFGVAAAWGVTKFRFKGRSLLVALIDLPFSVSPVISGLVFVLLFGAQGIFAGWAKSTANLRAIPLVRALPWMAVGLIALAIARRVVRRAAPTVAGRWWSKWAAAAVVVVVAVGWSYATNRETSWAFLRPADWAWWCPTWEGFGAAGHAAWWPFGWERKIGVIFTPLAIVLASAFVTFPFVGRSLIPLMEAQGVEAEQAAISLGAGGWYTFRRVTLPSIKWGLLYGVILCSARAFGEFGAVSVVSGHLDTNNTMPLRIETLWQEYKTQAAFTVASLLAMLAVVTLVVKTFIEWKTRRDADDETAPKPVLGAVARH